MRRWLAAAVMSLAATPAWAQANGPLNTMSLPRTATRTVEVRAVLPEWVAMPPSARVLTSEGLEMRPLRSSAVTLEHVRLGFLVGALVNAGACATDLRAFLQYTDDRWRPVGPPIESEGRVDRVNPGGILPYRFRLKRVDDFDTPPAGYIVQVVQDGKPVADTLQWVSSRAVAPAAVPCETETVSIEATATRSRATWRGYRVSGTLTVRRGGPVRVDAITLTALLQDANGDVLDVLAGTPEVRENDAPQGLIGDGQSLAFSLSTDVPLGKAVATTTVLVDLLDRPRTATTPPGQ